MRILYFVNGIGYKGGIGRIVVDKANYMADKLNHDVAICLYDNNLDSAYPVSPKVRLIPLGGGIKLNSSSFGKCWGVIKSASLMKSVIHDWKPDVIVNEQTQMLTWMLPFVCRQIPKVIVIHFSRMGMEYNLEGKTKLFKRTYFHIAESIYSRYDRFVVLTNEDSANWKLNNKMVIPNFSTFTTDTLSDLKSKRVICVARYHVQKRLDLLLKIWSLVYPSHKDWNLSVFGSGPDKAKLQKQVHDMRLDSSVSLNESIDDVKAEYLKSSIFCLTSQHEGQALVLLEAILIGLPICAFNVVGVNWSKAAALSCDFGDVATYANNLMKLMDDAQLRKKLRDKALKEVAPKYEINHIMSMWDDLFVGLTSCK